MIDLGERWYWCRCLPWKHLESLLIGMCLIIRLLTSSWYLKAAVIELRLNHPYLLILRDLKIHGRRLVESYSWILIISQLHVIFLLLAIVSKLKVLSQGHCVLDRNVDKLLALKSIQELQLVSLSISRGGIGALFDDFPDILICVYHACSRHWSALKRLHYLVPFPVDGHELLRRILVCDMVRG